MGTRGNSYQSANLESDSLSTHLSSVYTGHRLPFCFRDWSWPRLSWGPHLGWLSRTEQAASHFHGNVVQDAGTPDAVNTEILTLGA